MRIVRGFEPVACCLATIALAGAARAGCRADPPSVIATTAAMKPYADRFNALATEDPYLLTGKTAARWQALVDELAQDGRVPADLVARSEMMLAGALQGEAAIQPALAAAQDALKRAESSGITEGSLHAAFLTMLAAKEVSAGKSQQALAHADAALAEAERADGTEGWSYGNAALTAGDAHFANGDYSHAEPLSGTAERLAATCLPVDTSIIGMTIASHASDLESLGRIEEALVEEERAVTWDAAHLPESDPNFASALADLGFFLHLANRQREAEALLRRATDLYARYQPDDLSSRALTMSKFANVLASEGKYREAEQMWLAAIDFYARTKDRSHPLAGSGPLRRAADAAQEQGKLNEALDLRRRAIELIESRVQPHHPELARAKMEYASTLAVAGRAREALAIAEPAVAILREIAPPADPKRITAEITYARVAGAAGVDPVKAYATVAPVVARMEAVLLDSATSRGDLIRFAPGFAASFASVAQLALLAHDEEAAFRAIQLANLSEIVLVSADAAARAAADPRVRTLIEQLNARARDRQRFDQDRLAANARGDVAMVSAADIAIRRIDNNVVSLTSELDRTSPGYRTLRRPQLVTLADYHAQLGTDDILLAPLMLPGETLVVAVTREGLRWTSVREPRSRVTELVSRIRTSIEVARQDPHARFDTPASHMLATIMLPSSLAPTIATHRHLIYYASGALATVAPALLVTSPIRVGAAPAWLIRSHSISIATTLTPRSGAERAPRNGFLGIGAPALGGKPLTVAMRGIEAKVGDFGKAGVAALPPLPNAARELHAMGGMFPVGQRRLLLGAAATKPALEALPLTRYGVIALATHGLVADALPGLTQPALVLTPTRRAGVANDGLLTAADVAGLHLDADWVILSACNTAGGSDPQGGSYSGLASAFIQAGARALLVSHWPVRDDAAARITVATLAATRRGVDRPQALRQAMLKVMRDRRLAGAENPAIWAPFVLIER